MRKLMEELRRRQVFRTIGLYVGGIWITLQVAEVLLPVYEAPDWIMKGLLTAGIIGLPIAIAMAWFYDLTSTGLHREVAADEAPATTRGRGVDFVVIGILAVALTISLIINFLPQEPVAAVQMEPVSVLIADFDNGTGDSVFNGALEQALTIAIEESSFITAFDRTAADRTLQKISEGAVLDESGARLVAAREGIDVVIRGELAADKNKYRVGVVAMTAETGDVLANLDSSADGRSNVLGLVSELAVELREKLGDATAEAAPEETFTTESIEAMHDYVNAQRLARDGHDEEAIGLYQSAVAIDPDFGRAWSGLGVSADKLGRTDVAAEAWKKTLALLDGMTERERYRTAGVYYGLVARNSQKAIENYEQLVAKYPADNAGYNNLAFSYFLALQFDKALAAGRKVVDIYPTNPMYHANFSLYAMYANDFDTAISEAKETLRLNPAYHKAYLPFAAQALIAGDVNAAVAAYDDMAKTGPRGLSLAKTGIADLLLWSDDLPGADVALSEGLQVDAAAGNRRAMATKIMMQAYSLMGQAASADQVVSKITESLALSRSTSRLVPAALMYIELGQDQQATDIAASLAANLDLQKRAYAKLIVARTMRDDDQKIAAVGLLQEAVGLADVWLLRFYLGQAYYAAGLNAEAVLEFSSCKNRLGEAFALFLDDTPTFRYTAELDRWHAQVREKMTTTP